MRPIAALATSALAAALAGAAENPQTIDFDKQIFPLFDEHCLDCHGDDDADAGLRLDTFAGLLKGGDAGASIVAGKGEESLLVKFLEGRSGKTGKNQFMPPGKRDHLKPEEIALVKAWIDAGAKGPVIVEGKPMPRREIVTPKIAPKGTPQRAIHAVAFSDKAQFIAVGRMGEVELINPATRAGTRKLSGFKGKVNALAFSPDGVFLYAAGGEPGIAGEVRKWQVADGKPVRGYEGHTDACHTLAISADGSLLATGGYDQKIRLWNAETGEPMKVLEGHNGAVNGLAFRPDGKVLASASADRTVKLWSIPAGGRLDTFSQPLKEQQTVVFSPDGKRLFAGGADNRIRVWNISASAKEGSSPLVVSRFAHEGAVLNLAFSADGKMLVSSAADKTVKVWSAADIVEKFLLDKQPDWPQALAFANKTQFVATRLDGSLDLYDAATGKRVPPPAPPKVEVSRIDPPGVQSGASSLVTLTGKNLDAEATAKFSHPGLKGVIAKNAKETRARLRITADASVPRGAYDFWLSSAAGDTARMKIYVEDLPHVVTSPASFKDGPVMLEKLPAAIWGTLTETGQQDVYRFRGKKGETLVFDLGVKSVGSKALTPSVAVLDAAGRELAVNRGLDSGSDPFLAFEAPADGEYQIRVIEVTLEGSPDYSYRLLAGALPYVTSWFPLSARADSDVSVHLIGPNLPDAPLAARAEKPGMLTVPLDEKAIRSRKPVQLLVTDVPHAVETEPNNQPAQAQVVAAPVSIGGVLTRPRKDGDASLEDELSAPDVDLFAFEAQAGQELVIETLAAMAGSPADTKIEVLYPDGKPVPRLLLQAVRDSWINFRSIDADNPDARVANWQEMDLKEYIYFSGDVARIFRLPRGPDSGFLFFANGGKRRAYFDTSATAHALDEPCYVVEPRPLDAEIIPNGLPVITLNYANDDSGNRRAKSDSFLIFTAPKTGRYLARVSDTRGWSGERYVYRLTIRQPEPGFSVAIDGGKMSTLPAGGAIGFSVRADRKDGFDGSIEVKIEGIPTGYYASSPLVIEGGHDIANGSLHAAAAAAKDADWSKVKVTACAGIGGQQVCKTAPFMKAPPLGEVSKFVAIIEPDLGDKPAMQAAPDPAHPLEITIAPGQTVKAWLRVDRKKGDELINFDVHNLPHGVIVDNIGLNGVQIREKESQREIFLTAAKWVEEQDRLIHSAAISARAEQDSADVPTSFPVLLKVRKPAAVTAR